jgi:hypothetical protein
VDAGSEYSTLRIDFAADGQRKPEYLAKYVMFPPQYF